MAELTQQQRDDLVEVALMYTNTFRTLTRDLTLDETIFFLKCLRVGIEGAEAKFLEQKKENDGFAKQVD